MATVVCTVELTANPRVNNGERCVPLMVSISGATSEWKSMGGWGHRPTNCRPESGPGYGTWRAGAILYVSWVHQKPDLRFCSETNQLAGIVSPGHTSGTAPTPEAVTHALRPQKLRCAEGRSRTPGRLPGRGRCRVGPCWFSGGRGKPPSKQKHRGGEPWQ